MLRLLFILIFNAALLTAAPAFQEKKIFKQGDGSFFSAHLKGDEYLHWIETDNKDILLFNTSSKQYEYAMIKDNDLHPSGHRFTPISSTTKAPAIHNTLQASQLFELWKTKRQIVFEKRKTKQRIY